MRAALAWWSYEQGRVDHALPTPTYASTLALDWQLKLWDRLKLIWYGGFAVTGAVLGMAYGLAGYGVLGAFGWAVLGVAAAARFEIRKISGGANRINFDNITATVYSTTSPTPTN